MKPNHVAKIRLAHYENALRVVKEQYPNGIYHVCLILRMWSNGMKRISIDLDYPEFWAQRPLSVGIYGGWFYNNEARIKAVERAIELVKQRISRNELD